MYLIVGNFSKLSKLMVLGTIAGPISHIYRMSTLFSFHTIPTCAKVSDKFRKTSRLTVAIVIFYFSKNKFISERNKSYTE